MATLFNINQFVNHWSNEWNYPVNKSTLINFLETFHNDIIKINIINDYELNLLNVVIMTYLYNLDETNYYDEISGTIERIKNDYPNEYRTHWLFANFLISAAKPLAGYNEFKKIFDIFNNDFDFYPLDFLNDYAYACIMVQMPKTGMEIYELSAGRGGTPLSSNGLYKSIAKCFLVPSSDGDYTDRQTWEIIKSNNEYHLRSRMLGSLFPLSSTWNIRITRLNNKKSFCIIKPDRLLSKQNHQIGITILIEFNLENLSYDEFIKT
jgi:hypothetical protein